MQHQSAPKHKQLLGITLVACVWIGTAGPARAQSIQTVRESAIKGDAKAQTELGLDYMPQNYAKAAYWLDLAAKQGDAQAENDLGVLYDFGHGLPQNYTKAAYWYRLAAKQGNSWAQGNLGFLYYAGHGVPQNYAKAYFWFDLEAVNGNKFSSRDRDMVARLMTPAEIAQAQNLATQYASEHK